MQTFIISNEQGHTIAVRRSAIVALTCSEARLSIHLENGARLSITMDSRAEAEEQINQMLTCPDDRGVRFSVFEIPRHKREPQPQSPTSGV